MKKESKYISLELAKELQKVTNENNFKLPKSEYCWIEYFDFNKSRGYILSHNNKKLKYSSYTSLLYAYDVAELGEILPVSIGDKTWLNYTKSFNGWEGICEKISYDHWKEDKGMGQMVIKSKVEINNNPYTKYEKQTITEADLRAKMLIYLIKNKLIKEIKQ